MTSPPLRWVLRVVLTPTSGVHPTPDISLHLGSFTPRPARAVTCQLLARPQPVGFVLLLCPARYPPQSVAACLSIVARRILSRMGTKSRETIYGASIRAAAERATEARKEADRLAVEAWNKRMLGFQGPAQPSPTLGDAINAGFGYLEVKCLGCNTHQTVALDIVRRPKATPVHELERYMRCTDCSEAARATVQAQPSRCAAAHQDIR